MTTTEQPDEFGQPDQFGGRPLTPAEEAEAQRGLWDRAEEAADARGGRDG